MTFIASILNETIDQKNSLENLNINEQRLIKIAPTT